MKTCITFAIAKANKANAKAQMAELVDALVSNTSGVTSMPVRSRLWVLQTPDNQLIIRGFLFSGVLKVYFRVNVKMEQRQSFGEVKNYVVATFGCLKEMLETMKRYHDERMAEKEEAKPVPFHRRIYNKVTSLVRPKLFLFSAGLIVCATSLFLNVRLAERMGQLQDNDMKYRYLLMQGQADGNTLERLENKFKWQRDERFIRSLTDSVLDFEERCRRQVEALERAKLLNEQAEQLKKEADRLGNQ